MHGTAVWVQRQDGSAVSMLLCCSPQCHSEHGASTERATHSAPERPWPATPAPGRAPSRGRGSELPSSDFGLQTSEFRVQSGAACWAEPSVPQQTRSEHGASTHSAPPREVSGDRSDAWEAAVWNPWENFRVPSWQRGLTARVCSFASGSSTTRRDRVHSRWADFHLRDWRSVHKARELRLGLQPAR
jgi:hypothetical protein